jgi:DNA-binding response OmpR family regulator
MTPDPSEHASILFVDPSRNDDVLASLRSRFEVVEAPAAVTAIRLLKLVRPSAIVTELTLPDGDGVSICHEAKKQQEPAAVLVTTATASDVPDALIAGCDSVLLKPFPPNLLHARLARLLRQRARRVQQNVWLQNQKLAHLKERFEGLQTGTNRIWPDTHCPSCGQGDAVSFDATSHRRWWFACLKCRHVWIAKRGGVGDGDDRRRRYPKRTSYRFVVPSSCPT